MDCKQFLGILMLEEKYKDIQHPKSNDITLK